MHRIVFLLLAILIIPTVLRGQAAIRSNYFAGFKTLHLTDTLRVYKPNTPKNERLHFRPIDVDVWYPSIQRGSSPLVFGDLFTLLEQRAMTYQEDTDYTGITEELASFYVAQLGVGTDGKALLDIRTRSFADLIPSPDLHPVIVYLAGFNGMGFENYKVLEKLAESGFVVIAIGSNGRYLGI